MIKYLLSLVLVSVSGVPSAQATSFDDFLKKVNNPYYAIKDLKQGDQKASYQDRDFAPLLKPKSKFLGFIGPDYQRLRIQFDSVKKSGAEYLVTGTSEVKGNRCNFTGTIQPEQIREYKKIEHSGEDGLNQKDRKQGLFFGHYQFTEDKTQKHPGVFDGYMVVAWRISPKGKFGLDDNEAPVSDWYSNNQYIGTWTAVDAKTSKPAHWGEYRIPDSGDLDIGAGEFGPSEKYLDRGWKDRDWQAP